MKFTLRPRVLNHSLDQKCTDLIIRQLLLPLQVIDVCTVNEFVGEVCLLGRSGSIFIFSISAHSCCKTTILSQLTLGPLLKIPYTHTNVTVATSGRCFRSKRHPRRNPSINNGDMSQNVENDVRNGIGLQVSEIRKKFLASTQQGDRFGRTTLV